MKNNLVITDKTDRKIFFFRPKSFSSKRTNPPFSLKKGHFKKPEIIEQTFFDLYYCENCLLFQRK